MSNLAKLLQHGIDIPNEDLSFASTFERVPAETLPPGRRHVEAALNYLAGLEDNWNGEGAVAPTEKAIEAGRAFNNHYMLDRQYPDKVAPDGDGALLFIWNTAAGRLTLTIEASLIHISLKHSDGRVELPDSVPYDLTAIPKEILQFLPKVR
jgi:hypothetical protein